jgi:hypothetical protein
VPCWGFILPSAQKAHSRNFGCSILHSLGSIAPENVGSPDPMHSSQHEMLWCHIDMRRAE